jgi:hypothetical protein
MKKRDPMGWGFMEVCLSSFAVTFNENKENRVTFFIDYLGLA